jgi:ribonuclease E
VQGYVQHVAPDLEERLERYDRSAHNGKDSFTAYRVEEQIAKGLDRKVWLPSGGSLVIDRTEAMTVVDVNTGKFTGSGGNLEETVTKNNLEAAEEMVRQLRLRDIGGIIVIDFIDMVLESNRDLVLRRLVECLGRDRTRHQVAEVTSLGLVQMTRKRIGTGLVEAFSEPCTHCQGRGVVIRDTPVEPAKVEDEARRGGARRSRGGRGRDDEQAAGQDQAPSGRTEGRGNGRGNGVPPAAVPSPTYVAAVAKPENAAHVDGADQAPTDEARAAEPVEEPTLEPTEATTPEPAVEPATEPSVEAAAEPAAVEEPPAAPEAPKVVTRTRRRSASRPTTVMTAPPAAPVVAPEPESPAPAEEASVQESPVQEAPVQEALVEETAAPAVAPEPPTVVTRTRGRRATRPAGPPSGGEPSAAAGFATTGSVGAPPLAGTVEPGTAVTEPGQGEDPHAESHPVEHVPIKKKGSRKR